MDLLKKVISSLLDNALSKKIKTIDNEKKKFQKVMAALNISEHDKVLDVGCGYGRNMKRLNEMGLNVIGVDINKEIIEKNRIEGMNCVTVEEFSNNKEKFKVILMSHVIEHLTPAALLEFLNFYLSFLQEDGHLVIITPLFSPYFYDDFDHIKPYQPIGLKMIFSDCEQVQYSSKHRMSLEKLYYRKTPFKLRPRLGSMYTAISMIFELFSAILYRLTFGLVSRTDGWIGVFKFKAKI